MTVIQFLEDLHLQTTWLLKDAGRPSKPGEPWNSAKALDELRVHVGRLLGEARKKPDQRARDVIHTSWRVLSQLGAEQKLLEQYSGRPGLKAELLQFLNLGKAPPAATKFTRHSKVMSGALRSA